MADQISEDEFGGQVRIRCDYETYVAFRTFSEDYYSYEHALRDLLRVAEENPSLTIGDGSELGLPESNSRTQGWG